MRKLIASVVAAAALLVAAPAVGASVPSRVPKACLSALDHAETLMDYAVEGFGYAADGFNAASVFDADGLDEAAENMNTLAPLIGDERDAFDDAAARCRAKS